MNGIERELVFYKEGFFGYGTPGEFVQWSPAHFAPIIATVLAIVALWFGRERIRTWRYEKAARSWYVFLMLMVGMSYYWRLLYVGPGNEVSNTLMDRLPLQVCEWTCVICCFMMLNKSKLLFDMTFFLTMSFSLLPLLFPAVLTDCGPTYYRYYQFWGEHLLPIFGMFYMMFVHRMRPHPRGIALVIAMLMILAVPSCLLNSTFEAADYLYLKPGEYDMIAFMPNSLFGMIALYTVVLLALLGVDWLVWKLITRNMHLSEAEE